jgi:hypothetical protein
VGKHNNSSIITKGRHCMIVMMQFKKKQLNGSTKEDVAKKYLEGKIYRLQQNRQKSTNKPYCESVSTTMLLVNTKINAESKHKAQMWFVLLPKY